MEPFCLLILIEIYSRIFDKLHYINVWCLGKIWSKNISKLKYWSPKKGKSKIGRCPWNNSDTHSPSGLLDQVFLEVGPSTKLKSNLDKIELLCSISTKYLKTSSSSTGLKWIEQKPCRHSLSVFSKIKCLHWRADSSKYYFESLSSFVNRKGTKPEQINGYSKLLFQI